MGSLTPRWRSEEKDRSGESTGRNYEFGWVSAQLEVLRNATGNSYK